MVLLSLILFSKHSHNASEVILLSKYLFFRCPIANLNNSFCIIYLKINIPIEPMHMWTLVLTLLPVLDGYLLSKCGKKLMVSLGNYKRNHLLHYYTSFVYVKALHLGRLSTDNDTLHERMTQWTRKGCFL